VYIVIVVSESSCTIELGQLSKAAEKQEPQNKYIPSSEYFDEISDE
jgi:hypothetical protein